MGKFHSTAEGSAPRIADGPLADGGMPALHLPGATADERD